MKKNVVVFGGRACLEEKKEYYYNLAYQTGKLLAEAGFIVVTGAGPGLMDETLRGAVEANGETMGVCLNIKGRKHSIYAQKQLMFDTIRPRQAKLIELADAFIALPGGIGTIYETIEILVMKKTNEVPIEKPLVLLGPYYENFKKLLQEISDEGFADNSLPHLFHHAKTPEEASLYIFNSL